MRIHHLNCGTCCPVGGRFFDGASSGALGRLVCHCLLVERPDSLILVDTGFGARDVADPGRLPKLFRNLNNIQLRPEETAIAQVRALGFHPEDVRHIVVSHLDFDHAGGIGDFPHAAVHLIDREWDAARMHDGGKTGALRYQPQQWDDVTDWRRYRAGDGERWFGFEAVRGLDGLPPEILLVPLAGHTWGHAGVAIAEPGGWLFYAADAYFYRGEVLDPPERTPGLTAYQTMMEVDRAARLSNQARLRRLQREHGDAIRMFCGHDATEFDLLAAGNPTQNA